MRRGKGGNATQLVAAVSSDRPDAAGRECSATFKIVG